MDETQTDIYLTEAGVVMGGFLWLISWFLKGKIEDPKTLDKAALGLPIAWAIFGALWIYLRTSGIVSLPW